MPTPAPDPAPRRWARAARELPLLAALALGVALVVRPGPGWFYPEGVDWEQYLEAAVAVADPGSGAAFPGWRRPLHALVVGLLGARSGYVAAAQALAVGCAAAVVVAAGLLGRSLSRPWVGALAALTAANLAPVALAARQVTPYPLLAAAVGLALALGAACSRWPTWPLAFGAGLAAGLAWAADPKGVIAPPLAILLVGVGLLRLPPRAWGRAACLAVGLGVGLGLPILLETAIERHLGLRPVPLAEQIESQRWQNLDQLGDPNLFSVAVRRACTGAPTAPSPGALLGPCGAAMLDHNLAFLRVQGAVPDGRSALLAPLCLLPAAWGPRTRERLAASLAAFLAVWLPLLAGLAGLLWVSHGVRYVLHLAVPIAVLVPLALDRLLGLPALRWPRGRPWSAGAAALVAGLWLWQLWPGLDLGRIASLTGPNAPVAGSWDPALPDPRVRLSRWLASQLGPDDLVIDCAASSIESFVLPRRLATLRALPHENERCAAWMQRPPDAAGERWLLTRHLPNDPGRRFALPADLPARLGWEEVSGIPARPWATPWPECCEELHLWRWPR